MENESEDKNLIVVEDKTETFLYKNHRGLPAILGIGAALGLGDAMTGLLDGPFSIPKDHTYGSNCTETLSPYEWKTKKKEQDRNAPCACHSGLKYKKCCGKVKK